MSSLEGADLQAIQVERAKMKGGLSEDAVASSLMEGQQIGVAEKRQVAEAEQRAQMERIQAELKALEEEVSQLEAQIAELETKNEGTQAKVAAGGLSVGIHQQVLAVRNGEIAQLKQQLEAKKEELDTTRDFVNLSRPEALNA